MRRAALTLTCLFIFAACGSPDAGPTDPAGEDAYYALIVPEVIERSEEWLGSLPAPSAYCVAIAPGYTAPDPDRTRAPSAELLRTLNEAGGISYHPIDQCTGAHPWRVPSGEAAGLVWVEPLGADRRSVMVGWMGNGDATKWGCRFTETEGKVKLDACRLWSET